MDKKRYDIDPTDIPEISDKTDIDINKIIPKDEQLSDEDLEDIFYNR